MVGVEKLYNEDRAKRFAVFQQPLDAEVARRYLDCTQGRLAPTPAGLDGPGPNIMMDAYAAQARLHMATYGTTQRQIAAVAAKNHEHSRHNVRSQYRNSMSIGEVLAAHDSALARWPDRGALPLRVWIQPMARVRDWTPNHVAIVRDAFIEWGESGVPLAFSFVLDSASADVHVSWIDRFNEPISGKTLWSHDNRWSILEASIVLAVHHRTGELLDTAATRAIALHEVGHLIGLDHTTDTTSIMTPRVRVKVLSPADLATARLLYLLPPGPIGGERSGKR